MVWLNNRDPDFHHALRQLFFGLLSHHRTCPAFPFVSTAFIAVPSVCVEVSRGYAGGEEWSGLPGPDEDCLILSHDTDTTMINASALATASSTGQREGRDRNGQQGAV